MQWDRLLWQSGFVVEYAQIGSSSWVSFRTVLARNLSYLTQHLLPGGLGSVSSSHGYFSFQKVSKALNFHRWFQQSFIYFMQNEREMRVQAGPSNPAFPFFFSFWWALRVPCFLPWVCQNLSPTAEFDLGFAAARDQLLLQLFGPFAGVKYLYINI